MVLFLVAFSQTNGASVAVDSKELNSETGSDSMSNNGGLVEEKLDPRSSGLQTFNASALPVSFLCHCIANGLPYVSTLFRI